MRYVDPDHTQIEAVVDGVTMSIPADPANRHYRRLVLEAGATVAPYVAPPAPARRVISPREARTRINSYWPAILTASRTNDDVYDWIIQANAGPIELDNPLTVQGLDALIATGLLDQAGKDAFLADAEGGYPA